MKGGQISGEPLSLFAPSRHALRACREGAKSDSLGKFLFASYPYPAYLAGEADPAYPVNFVPLHTD